MRLKFFLKVKVFSVLIISVLSIIAHAQNSNLVKLKKINELSIVLAENNSSVSRMRLEFIFPDSYACVSCIDLKINNKNTSKILLI
ncbi:MAG: hypothetical protein ACXVCY_02345 [Pseudobdellovibrionaceae bacterium]